jgi:sulfite reductase (NADPH) flavoprotein alpha-component
LTVASRRVLTEIEAENAEHLGSVSAAHGFLPRRPPSSRLPASHAAWDEAAAEIPALWRELSGRSTLRGLPLLSAEPEDLPDTDLWRASVVLSALAYTYARCDVDDLHAPAPFDIPACIATPWTRVAERMGRRGPHVAYDDLVTQNYRLIDPDAPNPVRLENLHLLVPLLGNDTERAFLGVNVEIQAALTPVVESSVRAQEAVVADDRESLVANLLVMLEAVRAATDVAFPKIDPNPYAPIYADPVVWAKLVAPTGISVVSGSPGVSGAGSTGFQLLDVLLGRTRFDSPLGGEGKKVRDWFAPNARRLLDAVEEVSVRRYVAESGDRQLQGLFQSVLEAYAGDRGYLGVHRRKVYGFIQTAFKVGRPSTASGITGGLRDKTWNETDHHLGEAREERYEEFFSAAQVARLDAREDTAGARVQRVTFDVSDTGLVFRPGDRCAVLPAHTDDLVQRTLAALQSPADRPVPLSRAWRTAMWARFAAPPPPTLPLADFLRYARLRPLDRRTAKQLARLSGSTELARIVEERGEDRLELWEAFELAAAAHYDISRLTRAELWQDEALSRLVPPVAPRMYSISAPPDHAPFADALELTVGHLQFTSEGRPEAAAAQQGTASTFLAVDAERGAEVNLQVVRPLRFTLPDDPAAPVVMFAGGTGVAPFRGFIQARAADPAAGPTWLFAAARTPAELPYLEEFGAAAAAGRLRLSTAFSRASVDGVPARRVDAAILEPETAAALRELLRGTGGSAARFYVCGQASFAVTVTDALRAVAAEDGGDGNETIRELVGGGRLMTDLFTTFAPRNAPGARGSGTFDASDLVLRNDAEHGWWMAIHGVVYDVTEFRQLHPGGFRIIDDNAGVDATVEWEAIRHQDDSEIQAMLDMYKIGFLRRLDLGDTWGIALREGRTTYVPLTDVLKAWLRHLYLAVELQNSLRNDRSILDGQLTPGEDPTIPTPLKLMFAADLQSRMLALYLPALVGEGLTDLWALACGLFDVSADARELPARLRDLADGERGRRAADAAEALREAVRTGSLDAASSGPLLRALDTANADLVTAVKLHLRDGLLAFETHEATVIERGADDLMRYLRAIPEAVASYYDHVATAIDGHLTRPDDLGGEQHGGAPPAPRRTQPAGARAR